MYRKALSYIIILSLLTSITIIVFPYHIQAANSTYYVSSSTGNDNNTGTNPDSPWQTLAKVSSITFQAGDQVLLKSGDTWSEELSLDGAGSAANPITVSSYGTGNKPEIVGLGIDEKYCIYIKDPVGWKIMNLKLTGDAKNGIIIHLTGKKMGDYLWVENVDFGNITNGADPADKHWSCGIFAKIDSILPNLLTNFTVKGCTFNNVDIGIDVACITKMDVIDSTSQYCASGFFIHNVTDLTVTNWKSLYNGGQINVGAAGAGLYFVKDALIQDSEFAYTFRGDFTPDGVGFDFEGNNENIIFQRNYVHDNYGAGVMLFSNGGPSKNIKILNNTFENNSLNRFPYDQSCAIEFQSGESFGEIRNNTIYTREDHPAFGGPALSSCKDKCIIKDNTIIAGSNITYVNDDAAGVTYSGTWTDTNSRGVADYNDDVHISKTNNDYFQYTFTGTGIDLVSNKSALTGQMDVYIDSIFDSTIDCYLDGSTRTQTTVYIKRNLSSGTHTIKFQKKSGTNAVFDTLRVYTEAIPSNSVVGEWLLNDNSGTTASDSSGYGPSGTLNGPTWTTGKNGSGLSFDGVNDYVNFPNSNINLNSNFTISAWIKAPQSRSSIHTILAKGPKDNGHFELYIDTSGELKFYSNELGDFSSGIAVDDDKWHQIAVTYDGAEVRFYLDGILRSSNGANWASINEVEIMRFGSLTDGTLPYVGLLDEVKFYNYALSASDVQKLGLTGEWLMNEGSGTSTSDSSGYGNSGTLNGPIWTTGKNGNGLSFDGINDYVSFSNFNINMGANFTVAAWIKAPQSRSSYHVILAKGANNTGHFELYINTGDGVLRFYSPDIGDISSGVAVDDDVWHHVAVTYDGGVMRFYIDGLHRNATSASGTVASETETMRFGTLNDGTLPYTGILDEVKIYEFPLSTFEIQKLYSSSTTGLTGKWLMDEGSGTTTADSSGYAFNGTLNGPTWTIGKNGNGLSFDGINDYVEMLNNNINIGSNFTIAAWIKAPQSRTESHTILAKGTNNTGHYKLYINSTDGVLKFNSFDIGDISSGIAVDDNTWHHVAVTYGGSTMKFYIDGLLRSTAGATGTVASETETLRNGALTDGTSPYSGVLDEVKIYNHELVASEVQSLFNSVSISLIGEWLLNEGSGTAANDSSGYGLNGTVTGGAMWVTGKSVKALKFDGIDDYVNFSNSNVNPGNDFTIAAWVKASRNRAGEHVILAKGAVNSGHYKLYINSGDGILKFYSYELGDKSSGVAIDDNVWHHVAVTYDGGTMKFYVDGKLKGFTGATGSIASETETLRFGTNTAGSNCFAGLLDEIRIYSRELSEIEIQKLGLNGEWLMDEGSGTTTADSSGYAFNGTLNGPTWTTGKNGNGLSFDGINDYVEMLNNNINIGSNFTIAAWIKATQSRTESHTILAKGTNNTGHYKLYINSTDGVLKFNSFDIGDISSGIAVDDNTWHHVAVTYDGSTMKFYIDGLLRSTAGATGTVASETETLRIGALTDGTSLYSGVLDEVKIYKVSLDPQDVQKLYNSFATGLIGEWTLKDGSGTTVGDSSGYGSNGTLSGPTWVEGKNGLGLSFDGINNYVNFSNNNINLNSSFTIAAWIKAPQNRGSNHTIIVKGPNNTGHYKLYINSGDGILKFNAFDIGDISSGVPVDDNTWHHVAVIYDSSTMKFYLDNVLKNSVSSSGTIAVETEVLRFGTLTDGTEPYSGLLDEVKIYNCVLGDIDVDRLYNLNPKLRGEYYGYGMESYGEWKFDEGSGTSVYDSSIYGYSGSLNGPTWTTGKVGGGLSFDGVNDYVDIPNYNLNLGGYFTISTWIKAPQSRTSYHTIMAKGAKNTGHFEIYIDTNGILKFYSNDIGDISSGTVVDNNVWHHIAITFNGGTMTYYIDGESTPVAAGGYIFPETETLRFGAQVDGTSPYYGILDEVKFFNYTLGADQVRDLLLLNGGWMLDENSGTTVRDSSCYGYTGTISGPVWTTGKNGSGLSFDGINDYVNFANNTADIGGKFTISTWVKAPQSRTAAHVILAKGADNTGHFRLYMDVTTGILKFYSFDIGTVSSGVTVDDNTWHHVAVTYDGIAMKFFIDGLERSSSSAAGTVASEIETLRIGSLIDGTLSYSGVIDAVKIYGYRMQAIEVQSMYNSTSGGLIGRWKMDEGSGTSTSDSSGYSNTGTISGANWATVGRVGNAPSFDGVNDYINISNTNINISNKFTISVWIKAIQDRTTHHVILAKGAKDTGHFELYINTDGVLYFYSNDVASNNSISSGVVVDDNKWHHIAVTYDSDIMKFYIDGLLRNSVNTSGTVTNETETLRFGTLVDGTLPFKGMLDEIRIYQYDMTSSEIQDLTLVGNWLMDEGSGTTAVDSSGFGYNGTLYGPKWIAGALMFDGVDDYVENTSNSANLGSCFTINSRIKAPQRRSSHHVILAKGPKDAGHYEVYISTDGTLRFYSNDIGDYGSGVVVDDDKWHNVSVTYDGARIKFYMDGYLRKDLAASGTITDEIDTFRIAKLTDGTNPYSGLIDDVRIYGIALNDETIKNMNGKSWSVLGEWLMDEGSGTATVDTSNKGKDATINGAAWSTGKIGNGLSFDGVNDYMEVVNSSVNIGSSFTIAAWVNATQARSGYHAIMAKGPKDTGHFELYINQTDGVLKFYSNDIGDVSSGIAIDDGTWHHVAVTYNGSKMKYYIDGLLRASITASGYITKETDTLRIGSLADGALPFSGILDEVKVYSKEFTPSDIQKLFDITSDGLAGSWLMNEGSGTTTSDSSGFGNTGTITGAAWATGKYGNGLSFDGVDDYVAFSNFNINPQSECTLSAWIKAPQSRSSNHVFLAKGANNTGHFELYISTEGTLKFYSPDTGTLSSGYEVDDNTWHHIAVVFESGIAARFYIDGKLRRVASASGIIAVEQDTMRFGTLIDGTLPYSGILDELKIYNRKMTYADIKVLAQ